VPACVSRVRIEPQCAGLPSPPLPTLSLPVPPAATLAVRCARPVRTFQHGLHLLFFQEVVAAWREPSRVYPPVGTRGTPPHPFQVKRQRAHPSRPPLAVVSWTGPLRPPRPATSSAMANTQTTIPSKGLREFHSFFLFTLGLGLLPPPSYNGVFLGCLGVLR